jgi:hypothetical protein
MILKFTAIGQEISTTFHWTNYALTNKHKNIIKKLILLKQ